MSSNKRQRIERTGARRARLTPAPGTSAEPVPADEPDAAAPQPGGTAAERTAGPNDERLRRDVPPHW